MQLYDKKSILIDLKKHKSFLDKNIEKYIKTLDAPKEIKEYNGLCRFRRR